MELKQEQCPALLLGGVEALVGALQRMPRGVAMGQPALGPAVHCLKLEDVRQTRWRRLQMMEQLAVGDFDGAHLQRRRFSRAAVLALHTF